MSKRLLTYDLGKRAIYNYFVLDSSDNRTANLDIVNAWYPQTAKQEEIFILQKLLSIAHGKDGERFELSEYQFQLAFMVSDYKAVYKKTGELVGYQRDRDAIRRAINRFQDFEARGLVEGQPANLSVTFSGRLALEEKLYGSQRDIQKAQEVFAQLSQSILDIARQQNNNSDEIAQQLKEIIEFLKNQTSPSVGQVLSTIDTTASLFEKIKDGIPIAVNIISRLVSLIA